MAKRLKKFYYLEKFDLLIDTIEKSYRDILSLSEKRFITTYRKQSKQAKALFVRMCMRRGPLFLPDQFSYTEVPNVSKTIEQLKENRLIEIVSTVEEFDLDESDFYRCLSKEQIYLFLKEEGFHVRKSDNKSSLWAQVDIEKLCQSFSFIFPCYQQEVEKFLFMFFGNFEQSLSDFILEDLGILKYEKYQLTSSARYFRTRAQVDQSYRLIPLYYDFYELIELEDENLKKEFQNLLKELGQKKYLNKYRERAIALYGRFLEREGKYKEAIRVYELAKKAPSRERLARTLFRLEKKKEALAQYRKIEKNPLNYDEESFLFIFSKKLDVDIKSKLKLREEKLVLKKTSDSVEHICLNHYRQAGYQGFFLENRLWKAIFGLYFWDIIFMSVEGVFLNPFQRGPEDLFEGQDFIKKRKEEIDKRLLMIKKGKATSLLTKHFKEKKKMANHFVDWKRVKLSDVKKVVGRVPSELQEKIMRRMITRLWDNCSGFPDLFLYRQKTKDYLLVEVKGPGDQIRSNQYQWMSFFEKEKIPYLIAKISWGS